ncbi:hypothetical protein VP1G_10567 [Cytospora mali]|uniref:Uncharacterized protein n=1 Tax=Cytospora mali TaxID=578113 RepID=A0A194UPX5_CYTMA|nr:hypothetical protein VP1G_10567 [Valsa mali var. pyri (nom. inval.)]
MDHPSKKFTQAEELLVHLASFVEDHTTFWSLCLASRAFYRIFRAYLWAEVVWDDRNDAFFSDRDRLARFLHMHRRDLARAQSLRVVKSSKASTFGGHGEFPYLTSLETLQSHMPNLRSYAWAGPWNRDTIIRLARNCPRLERLCVRLLCDETPGKVKPRQSWDACQRTLPCLTSAEYYAAPSCRSMEKRATISGYLSRVILRQTPAIEDISFYWPKIQDIKEERRAVEDFVFYFIGFLIPEELSLDKGELSQLNSVDSWPPMLHKVELCVSAYDQEGKQVCPRCAGRPTGNAIAVDRKDHNIVSLMKRVADAFEWTYQDCLNRIGCSAWSDGDSFWHVSLTTPRVGWESRRR